MIYFLIMLLSTGFLWAQEYMYPVALLPDNTVALIYQNSAESTQLYVVDLNTHSFFSGLSSRYMPSSFMMLPNSLGFSFIDNGIIRIKYFTRRSAKTLEFSHPLHHINSMAWDDAMYMYISAQYLNNYELFQLDADGNLKYKLSRQKADFLYPQKQGSDLFFISRSIVNQEPSYNVSVFKFDDKGNEEKEGLINNKLYLEEKKNHVQRENCDTNSLDAHFRNDEYLVYDSNAIKTIVDFGNQPIAFLSMDTDKTGFAVGHASSIDVTEDADVVFSYYYFYRDTTENIDEADEAIESRWHTKKLFDFAIPISFVATDGKNRLYEYMTPLLPKKIDTFIYYSHSVNGILNLFSYSLDTDTNNQITFSQLPDEHYFCPIKVGSSLYVGGAVYSKPDMSFLKKIF